MVYVVSSISVKVLIYSISIPYSFLCQPCEFQVCIKAWFPHHLIIYPLQLSNISQIKVRFDVLMRPKQYHISFSNVSGHISFNIDLLFISLHTFDTLQPMTTKAGLASILNCAAYNNFPPPDFSRPDCVRWIWLMAACLQGAITAIDTTFLSK